MMISTSIMVVDLKINNHGVVVRSRARPDQLADDSNVRGVQAVINGNPQQRVESGPGGLDAASLGAVFQAGPLQQPPEVMVPGGDVQVAEHKKRGPAGNVLGDLVELVIPPPGVGGARRGQRVRGEDSQVRVPASTRAMMEGTPASPM